MRLLDDRRRRAGQGGMTLIETLLAVMMSALMVLPMMGWATLALKEQVTTQERNISGSALGLVRTYFVRDVSTADRATVEGASLEECRGDEKGEVNLLVLASGDRRVAYALRPEDGFTWMLRRIECAAPGAPASSSTELAGDIIEGGTSASCDTDEDLAAAAAAAAAASEGKGKETGKGQGNDKGKDEATAGSADQAAEPPGCRRVTLQLTTSRFAQVALTAMLRSGAGSGIPSAASPDAVATATPTSGPRRLRVQFDATGSTDPDGEQLSYSWDFGDGATAEGVAPVHEYEALGTHTATLTVTNESGLSASVDLTITVADNVPVAVIAAPATGTTTYRGEAVSFSSVGSNDDADKDFGGGIVGYAWDFGDGTTSTDANPTKSYGALSPPEGYTVKLAVFDDAGQTATTEIKVIVANRLPLVAIVASATSGTAPLTVDFSSIVVDETTMSPAPPLTYAWDFGDGGTSNVADPPPRTYATTGTRTVTLTVTDDQGAAVTATQTITVDAALLPAPTGLKKKASGKTGGTRWIDLQFNSVSGAAQYEVMITCVSSGCSDVGSATGAASPIRIGGLRNKALSWDAQVRTLNSTGQWGPWSAKVRVTT